MSKRKKGMSLDEKRQAMLDIFHTSGEVFNLKDLERLGTKAGVVTQTIKDVLQGLVDEKLVEQDKIGSGNFFFSFPSSAYLAVTSRIQSLEASIAKDEAAIAELEAKLKTLAADRGGGTKQAADRALKLSQLEELKAASTSLDKSLALHADNDPDVLRALQAKVKGAKDAADRWTDAVWSLKSHMVKKFGRDPKEVDKMLGITADFDYMK